MTPFIWLLAPCRHRTPILVGMRLGFALLAGPLTSCRKLMLPPEAASTLLVTGNLLLAARVHTLLICALGFQLSPLMHCTVQSLMLLHLVRHMPATCAAPFFQDAGVQELLLRRGS